MPQHRTSALPPPLITIKTKRLKSREVLYAKLGYRTFRALDLDQLTDKMRRGGVPDQSWQLLTADGARVAFCGFSIYALTGVPGPGDAESRRNDRKPGNSLSIEALATEKTELQLRLLKLNELPDAAPEKWAEIDTTRGRLQERWRRSCYRKIRFLGW